MTKEKRNGPKLTIALSCQGCIYEYTESYYVEDGNDVDSGCIVYCTNDMAVTSAPLVGTNGFRRVGDTTWNTPAWCPLRQKIEQSELTKALSATTC